MADFERKMQEYARQRGVSVDELRGQLDQKMQQNGGPTFEEGVERVHYIIDQTPQQKTPTYHRAKDLLQINTDLLTSDEAGKEFDKALDKLGVPAEVLAVMEVAVDYKKPLKNRPHRRKGEGWDPMFDIFHNARLD